MSDTGQIVVSDAFRLETMPSAMELLRNQIGLLLWYRHQHQLDLCKHLGRSPSWLSKFLRGQRNLSLEDLDAIAGFFGVEVHTLFAPAGEQELIHVETVFANFAPGRQLKQRSLVPKSIRVPRQQVRRPRNS